MSEDVPASECVFRSAHVYAHFTLIVSQSIAKRRVWEGFENGMLFINIFHKLAALTKQTKLLSQYSA